jgi:uncharacterized protein YecE (DUF72 family)
MGREKPDPLEFYARYFDTVEVNSTFYRPLAPNVAQSWAAKTPRDFRFGIKLYQKFTHPMMFEEATGAEAVLGSRDFERFLEGIAPLKEAGKLGPVLAQFPASFKRSDENLEHLQRLAQKLDDIQLVIELRHHSWTEDEAARNLLAANRVSWAHIDEPRFASSIGQVPNVGPLGYFRFHGRNAKQWWKGDAEERYNYLYSPREQADLAQQITAVAGTAGDTHVVYNNHYRARAVANGLQMKLLLGQDVPDDVPAPLLDEYPDLAKLLEREAVERRST